MRVIMSAFGYLLNESFMGINESKTFYFENDFELMEVIADYLIKTQDGFRGVYENIRHKED